MNRDDAPRVLYKYRNWNQFARQLLEGSVYFSTKEELNDPFEFRWRMKAPESEQEAAEIAKTLIRLKDPTLIVDSPEFRRWQREVVQSLKSHPDPHYRMYDQVQQGVFCASQQRDDIRLWSHYANGHRGICVGVDTKSFGNYFNAVKYTNEVPVLTVAQMPQMQGGVVDATATKSTDWKYEKEWRTFDRPGVKKLRENGIQEVILGAAMPELEQQEVIAYVQEHVKQARLWRAKLHGLEYRLELEPISE